MKWLSGKLAVAVLLLAGTMFLSGCGEKTCFFLTRDADGVQAGAPVVWYNAFVGKVATVGPEEGAGASRPSSRCWTRRSSS